MMSCQNRIVFLPRTNPDVPYLPPAVSYHSEGAHDISGVSATAPPTQVEKKNPRQRTPPGERQILEQDCFDESTGHEEEMNGKHSARKRRTYHKIVPVILPPFHLPRDKSPKVDQNNLNILREEEDVHVLTGSLKLFFRELKDPLIPFKQLVPALTAINNPKRKEKIREYRKIVGSLPGPNYDTLKFLLEHLLRVEKYNEFNRMNVNNLAIVFGPTLMWPEQESTNMALDFMQQNLVIECLLREFQEIFT